jgi:4-aminobutyrate aminotransferase-like enzyme
MLTPVGPDGALIKIVPPLITTSEELQEGLLILRASVQAVSEGMAGK